MKTSTKKRLVNIRAAACGIVVCISMLFSLIIIAATSFPIDAETKTQKIPAWYGVLMFFAPVASAAAATKFTTWKLNKDIEREERCEIKGDPAPVVDLAESQSVLPVQSSADLNEEEAKSDQPDTLEVIYVMEKRFEDMFKFAYEHMLNAEDCKRAYNALMKNFDYSKLPFAAQVRLEQLCDEYKEKFGNPNPMVLVDSMAGPDFEQWCAHLLLRSGFDSAEVTQGSGDQGVDIVAVKDGVWYAIQCKRYTSDLGNTPVQEVFAGKEMYGCQVAAVMTNTHFTAGAKELAEKTKVLLWDRGKILEMIKNYGSV